MKTRQTLAIIGSGPSCIYLLKHLLDEVEILRPRIQAIEIFEKRDTAGMGMPYNPETTERFNMSNISSEELPELKISFAQWLRGLDDRQLEELDIEPGTVSESEVYSRLALGQYLHAQYQGIIAGLSEAGIAVREHANCKIVNVREEQGGMVLVRDDDSEFRSDRVVIATGHYWPEDDHPESGYYVSPWPITKLLPKEGEVYNFTVGTLGASLSAFDVVCSLAHRHGTFTKKKGRLVFEQHPGTENFRMAMHSSEGLLPHLQYSQSRPLREIERHVSEKDLLALRDDGGFLRLATYFDQICRRVLIEAFRKDAMPEVVERLNDPDFGIADFAELMTEKHDYDDAFQGMIEELGEAKKSVTQDKPIFWKEAIDDLMYTLNFYAELMPAEDHLTLHTKFLPFLMNVIAALPLPSARTLLALHEAGVLEIIAGRVELPDPSRTSNVTKVKVEGDDGTREISYRMFVNCAGQKALSPEDFPFPDLVESGAIRQARAEFIEETVDLPKEKEEKVFEERGQKFFPIGGVDIDRGYRLIGRDGKPNERIFDIAFPHTSGERPYSYGLQACNDTARLLVAGWIKEAGRDTANT